MARTPDPSIPAGERLFRGLYEGWIDGDKVTLQAVDYRGTSVNRSKHSKPDDLLEKGFQRVGVLVSDDLPAPMVLNSVEWRFFAHDYPNPPEDVDNDAHAEIRTRRPSDGTATKCRCPGSDDARDKLRAALADKIKLL